MNFEIIGEITKTEKLAVGRGIHILPFLRKRYGRGRWRKLKGIATVIIENGEIRQAELHWFEAHGIGKKMMRIKRFID